MQICVTVLLTAVDDWMLHYLGFPDVLYEIYLSFFLSWDIELAGLHFIYSFIYNLFLYSWFINFSNFIEA